MLKRVIGYWSEIPVKVIVVDGSDVRADYRDSETLIYRHATTSYLARLNLATTLIDTKYVALCSDDEVYLPSALADCIRFLESNPDFVAASGESVGLIEARGKYGLTIQYPERQNFNLSATDACMRARMHLGSYRVCGYYSVARAAEWKIIWHSIARREFSPFAIQELQFEAAISFAGKMIVLPSLMWIRNNTITPIRGHDIPGFDARKTFARWWADIDNSVEKQEFLIQNRRLFGLLMNSPANRRLVLPDMSEVEEVFSAYFKWEVGRRLSSQTDFHIPRSLKVTWRFLIGLLKSHRRVREVSSLLSREASVNLTELHGALKILTGTESDELTSLDLLQNRHLGRNKEAS